MVLIWQTRNQQIRRGLYRMEIIRKKVRRRRLQRVRHRCLKFNQQNLLALLRDKHGRRHIACAFSHTHIIDYRGRFQASYCRFKRQISDKNAKNKPKTLIYQGFRLFRYSLTHTKWNCNYHVVFAPKYRRQAIYGKIKEEIGQILRKLCEQKGIEIIEAHACSDHIHMLLSIPPKISVSYAIGYLKGKSSLIIFDRHANLKYKYGNRHFWCRGYFVDTVGRNKEVIKRYIANQLQEDIAHDQISMRELIDPFTGEPVKKD